jgi:hypothetical protein
MDKREDRLKIVYLDVRAVVGLFNWHQHEMVSLPIIKGLPEGYWVRDVMYDFSRHAFALKVGHESFDPIEPGTMIPVWQPLHEIESRTFAVPQAADDLNEKAHIAMSAFDAMVEVAAGEPAKKGWEFLGAP